MKKSLEMKRKERGGEPKSLCLIIRAQVLKGLNEREARETEWKGSLFISLTALPSNVCPFLSLSLYKHQGVSHAISPSTLSLFMCTLRTNACRKELSFQSLMFTHKSHEKTKWTSQNMQIHHHHRVSSELYGFDDERSQMQACEVFLPQTEGVRCWWELTFSYARRSKHLPSKWL